MVLAEGNHHPGNLHQSPATVGGPEVGFTQKNGGEDEQNLQIRDQVQGGLVDKAR